MTTPQNMGGEKTPPGGEADPQPAVDPAEIKTGLIYKLITRLIAWLMFMGFLTLAAATVVFIGLALYRGIIWLWPGGVAL